MYKLATNVQVQLKRTCASPFVYMSAQPARERSRQKESKQYIIDERFATSNKLHVDP